jgi:hypothetical protein
MKKQVSFMKTTLLFCKRCLLELIFNTISAYFVNSQNYFYHLELFHISDLNSKSF